LSGPGVRAATSAGSSLRGIRPGTLVEQQPEAFDATPSRRDVQQVMLEARLRLLRRSEGQTLAEYAVILGVITLAVVGVFTALAGGVSNAMNAVITAF
jgi:Flp pilus assembly pilin Flp